MQGYFRDDAPLYELVLDESGRRELDALWYELDFVTAAPMRQYHDFIFFERAEPPRFMQEARFDFARAEDKDCTSEAKMTRLRAAYLEKARKNGADARAIEAIETYFTTMSARDPPGRAGPPGRRAAPPRGPRAVRRAGLSPADDAPSATTCWRSTASRASGAAWDTRRPSATRSPASCCRRTSASGSTRPGRASRSGRSPTTPWPAG